MAASVDGSCHATAEDAVSGAAIAPVDESDAVTGLDAPSVAAVAPPVDGWMGLLWVLT